MKVKKNSMLRMETLINNDRMKNSDGFLELLTGDIDKVLKDYFGYKGFPIVEVIKTGNIFNVKIALTAESVKGFTCLPVDR